MRVWLRAALITFASLVVLLGGLALAIVALSEMGEVVTIDTALPDGQRRTTRIWVVDGTDGMLVRGRLGTPWVEGARRDPQVTLRRGGTVTPLRAIELHDTDDHARIHRLMREKYGVADRIIDLMRDLDEVVMFRLEADEGENGT